MVDQDSTNYITSLMSSLSFNNLNDNDDENSINTDE